VGRREDFVKGLNSKSRSRGECKNGAGLQESWKGGTASLRLGLGSGSYGIYS
jgi:hypothetical protein